MKTKFSKDDITLKTPVPGSLLKAEKNMYWDKDGSAYPGAYNKSMKLDWDWFLVKEPYLVVLTKEEIFESTTHSSSWKGFWALCDGKVLKIWQLNE